ncbi:Alpha/Beta hydrolase protein [Aspergillus avenaceus]|uniref:Alpha/Beta hydrolase protein n=1 Tax=Aspergillus avenaceus TaxID=36643 RepID=A0A5N6U0A1_ASPAV|nr:Alpha/Beta hydrolase protein [Aspergillus avenaceus]
MSAEKVEFKTLDGIVLRGHLYPAKQKGPAVIMGSGFNCVKEMFTKRVAVAFQKQNITAFAYDPRSLGESDGLPRNEFDPARMAEDYSDALTFLAKHDVVDSTQVGFWGMSFSGPIALAAAAMDARAAFVIACCPWYNYFTKERVPEILDRVIKDRVARLNGSDPSTETCWTYTGSPAFNVPVAESRKAFKLCEANMDTAPHYKGINQITVETLGALARWSPDPLIDTMLTTPVMMIVPERDELAAVPHQIQLFERLKGPKRLHVAHGRDHFDLLAGPGLQARQKLQVDFIRDAVRAGRARL